MADSIRLQILKAIKTRLSAMDVPTYTFKFSQVALGPLGPSDATKRYMAGIVAGEEKKQPRIHPMYDCILPVTIEMRMTINQGDLSPAEEVERVLADVQTCLMTDTTCGGIALNCNETGNAVDLDLYTDKTVMAAVFLQVLYRHTINDPRTTV